MNDDHRLDWDYFCTMLCGGIPIEEIVRCFCGSSQVAQDEKNRVETIHPDAKGMDRTMVSFSLAPEERQLAADYARFHSISIGEAFKRALFEIIGTAV